MLFTYGMDSYIYISCTVDSCVPHHIPNGSAFRTQRSKTKTSHSTRHLSPSPSSKHRQLIIVISCPRWTARPPCSDENERCCRALVIGAVLSCTHYQKTLRASIISSSGGHRIVRCDHWWPNLFNFETWASRNVTLLQVKIMKIDYFTCDSKCEVLCNQIATAKTNQTGVVCVESPDSDVI